MSCIDCPQIIEQYGANPKTIQWNVVRGDTATLRVEFLENDEVTPINRTGWSYIATALNLFTGALTTLAVTSVTSGVDILATPLQTAAWGTGTGVVADLPFDLQITTNEIVWTPVTGTIRVLSDVTPGGSL